MTRPQGYRTAYVGKLSDGETLGYWLVVLSTPFQGRAIPFSLLSYSCRTIAQGAGSRNLHQRQAFADIKALLGSKPLAGDRGFSHPDLLLHSVEAAINLMSGNGNAFPR
jgi:hypothetical protein